MSAVTQSPHNNMLRRSLQQGGRALRQVAGAFPPPSLPPPPAVPLACGWQSAAGAAMSSSSTTERGAYTQQQRRRGLQTLLASAAAAPSQPTASSITSTLDSSSSSSASSSSPSFQGSAGTYQQAMASLSEEQRAAVEAPLGPTRVVAGPGSGKTRVLTARIAHLMHSHNVAPWQIVAITFTNKAAAELKERLSVLLGEARASRLTAGTFHSLCLRMLRRPADLARLPLARRDALFNVYDEDASLGVFKRLVKEAHPEWKTADVGQKAKQLQQSVSWVKNALPTCYGLGAEEAVAAAYQRERGPYLSERDVANVTSLAGWMHKYEESLQASNALDFDDLLGFAVALLLRVPGVREQYQQKWRHLLVDEFQDTNSPQYQLARLLTGPEANLFVVGDPDQAIYRFRGADVSNMQRTFQRDFPSARVYYLQDNYRSTAHILRAAQHVIDCNAGWERQQLRPRNPPGTLVKVQQLPTSEVEAAFIADSIAALAAQHPLEEMAVLYRRHVQSQLVERELVQRGIKYVILGGVPFWKRTEVQDVMAYLRLAVSLSDEGALLRVINTPSRKLGDTTVQRLRAAAQAEGMSLPEFLFKQRPHSQEATAAAAIASSSPLLADLPVLPDHKALGITAAAAAAVESFRAVVSAARHAVQTRPLAQALRDIMAVIKYKEHVAEGKCSSGDKSDPAKVGERLERLQQLCGTAAEYESTGGQASLAGVGEEEEEEEDGLSSRILVSLSSPEGVPAPPASPEGRLRLAAGFLDEAALYSAADAGGADAPGVRLMTMHAAKGLEFDVVFIPGCVEGNTPMVVGGSLTAEELEEERRLFFVAMTRARRQLHLLHTWETRLYGSDWRESLPSQFLEPVLLSGAAEEVSCDPPVQRQGRLSSSSSSRRASSANTGAARRSSSSGNSPSRTWQQQRKQQTQSQHGRQTGQHERASDSGDEWRSQRPAPQTPPTPAQLAAQRRGGRR